MKHTYRSLLISEGWVMTDEVETARIEAAEFFRQVTHVKSCHQKKFNKSGQAYTIYEDTGDGEASQKERLHRFPSFLKGVSAVAPGSDAGLDPFGWDPGHRARWPTSDRTTAGAG